MIIDSELIVISLVAVSGTVITMIPERFPQGPSNAGHHPANCFSQSIYRRRQVAHQEIVHA